MCTRGLLFTIDNIQQKPMRKLACGGVGDGVGEGAGECLG